MYNNNKKLIMKKRLHCFLKMTPVIILIMLKKMIKIIKIWQIIIFFKIKNMRDWMDF